MKNKKTIKNEGYAILFTMVVVAIIALITIGLSNAAYKQLILSAVSQDSMTAFYQSDIASECAMYLDNQYNMLPPTNPWVCGGYTLDYPTPIVNGSVTTYNLNPIALDSVSSNKCFRIIVTKTDTGSAITTNIVAKGYNVCNTSSMRTVERAVKIDY